MIDILALHFYEILRYNANMSTFLSEKEEIKTFGAPSSRKLVNFLKFKEIYLILSELDKFRTCKFDKKFQVSREILYEMVQHVNNLANYTTHVNSPLPERKSIFSSTFRRSM